MIEQLTDERDTVRVPVDGVAAFALGQAYARLIEAQNDVVTILGYLSREKHLEPAKVVGFDDERGELIVRI